MHDRLNAAERYATLLDEVASRLIPLLESRRSRNPGGELPERRRADDGRLLAAGRTTDADAVEREALRRDLSDARRAALQKARGKLD